MELLRAPESEHSIDIFPDSYANFARFFNGINNAKAGTKKKGQNVRSLRYNAEGKAAVMLYTVQAVKAGEQLCYDYNEGGLDKYPTADFV